MIVLDSATLTNNYIVGGAGRVKIAILGISNTQESLTRERRPDVPDTSTTKALSTRPHQPRQLRRMEIAEIR